MFGNFCMLHHQQYINYTTPDHPTIQVITLRTKLLNFRIRKENGVSNLVYTQITHICNVCTVAVPIAKVLSLKRQLRESRMTCMMSDFHLIFYIVSFATFSQQSFGVFFGGEGQGCVWKLQCFNLVLYRVQYDGSIRKSMILTLIHKSKCISAGKRRENQ